MPTGQFDHLLPEADFSGGFDEFTTDLLSSADLTDDERAVLRGAIAKPGVNFKLKSSVASRSAAQSMLDRARTAVTKAGELYDANKQWRDTEEQRMQAIRAGTNPDLQRPPLITAPQIELPKNLVTTDILSEVFDKQDRATLGFVTDTVFLMTDYSTRFGEALPGEDYEKIRDFAIKNGMTLRNAYSMAIKPKEEAKMKAEFEQKLKAEFERGRMEGASLRDEPTAGDAEAASGHLESVFKDSLLGRRRTQTLSDGKPLTGEEAFIDSWKKTNGFTVRPDGRNH